MWLADMDIQLSQKLGEVTTTGNSQFVSTNTNFPFSCLEWCALVNKKFKRFQIICTMEITGMEILCEEKRHFS